jgi:UDP-N-acetyl-D-mannosaminuronic acid dehydrogenase
MTFEQDVAVVGGCGHVGLPLAVALADAGLKVLIYDTNSEAVNSVNSFGIPPFMERGLSQPMWEAVSAFRLKATALSFMVSTAEHVIVVIGTPVDAHGNPDHGNVRRCIEDILPHLRDGQLLILRSTVYPGTTAYVEDMIAASGKQVDVAFCPERTTEGHAMRELFTLPQIISGRPPARERAEELFGKMCALKPPVHMSPEQAELAKLFTNTWRYIQFAVANEFWRMASDHGLDYEKIRAGMMRDYPRNAGLPSAGFAAGPCLVKDTTQLVHYDAGNFQLGRAALSVNEGLPLVIIDRLKRQCRLKGLTVGILGMAFKAGSDDVRSSLAYKLRRALEFEVGPEGRVLCTDPYVTSDSTLLPQHEVLESSDIIIVGAPHEPYRRHLAEQWTDPLTLIAIWGCTPYGVTI